MKRTQLNMAAMALLMAQGQQRAPMPGAWCDGLPIANRMGMPGQERVVLMHGSSVGKTQAFINTRESATIAPTVAPSQHEYFLGPS